MSDNVNHPSHYETGKYECIDVMIETQGIETVKNFCICNAFKYLYRHENKNGVEDVRKAKWYLDKYLELVGYEVTMGLANDNKCECQTAANTIIDEHNMHLVKKMIKEIYADTWQRD